MDGESIGRAFEEGIKALVVLVGCVGMLVGGGVVALVFWWLS